MDTRTSIQTPERGQETQTQTKKASEHEREHEHERQHENENEQALTPTLMRMPTSSPTLTSGQVQLQTPAPSFDLSDFPNHCRLDFEIIVKNGDWGTTWTDCVRAAVDLQREAGYPVSILLSEVFSSLICL